MQEATSWFHWMRSEAATHPKSFRGEISLSISDGFKTAPVAELDQRCFVTLNDSAIELPHFDARQFSLTWGLKKCEEKHAALS